MARPPAPVDHETVNADAPSRTGSLKLGDGRRLEYAEWGDIDGVPIVHHHGMPGSRLDHAASADLCSSLGVRVITPERPGYGLSGGLRRRTILDWPRDVAQLADHLKLSRFAVTGLSGGGIYALACASAIPDRLTEVVLAGCPAPLDRPEAMAGMRWENRVGLRAAALAPSLFRALAATVVRALRWNPELFLVEGTHDQPPADRTWTALPWVRADEIENLREAFRQGALAYAQDISLLARPWGFDLGGIDLRIRLWHGDADRVIPLHHAKYLASMLPHGTLRVCRGEGHMLLWNHIAEILAAAAGRQPLRLVR